MQGYNALVDAKRGQTLDVVLPLQVKFVKPERAHAPYYEEADLMHQLAEFDGTVLATRTRGGVFSAMGITEDGFACLACKKTFSKLRDWSKHFLLPCDPMTSGHWSCVRAANVQDKLEFVDRRNILDPESYARPPWAPKLTSRSLMDQRYNVHFHKVLDGLAICDKRRRESTSMLLD